MADPILNNTGNAVPSTDYRDLQDNMQVLDAVISGTDETVTDRTGSQRRTLAGIDALAQSRIAAIGYDLSLGDYAAGKTITDRGEVVLRDGEYYKAAASASLPLVLSGTWGTDSASLVSVGDAVLRGDLLSSGLATVGHFGLVAAEAYSAAQPDISAAVTAAQAEIGAAGVLHFPLPVGWSEAHYLIDTPGFDFSGSWISADPGVVIHAPWTNDNEGSKPRTVGDVVFSEEAPSSTNTYRTQRGENRYPVTAGMAAAMASAAATLLDMQKKFPFDTLSRAVRISNVDTGAYTLDASGMTISADQAYWSTPSAAGTDLQGVEFAAAAGAEIGCLIHNVSSGGSSGNVDIGVRAVAANGASYNCCFYRFSIDGSTFSLYRGTTLLKSYDIDHPANELGDTHGVIRAGIRIGRGSRSIQLIINGQNFGQLGLGTGIAQSIYFVADEAARATVRLKYAVARCRDILAGTKPLRIAALGDSITRGARTTTEWPRLLQAFAPHLPGIGEITDLTNLGVSGKTARAVVVDIASYDFSGYDYVLVMLGTNDCQSYAAGGVSQFYSDIATIGNAIVADGARPIFGISPVFTSSTLTGNGNTTANMDQLPIYQQVIRERVINAGWEVAEVDDFFGANYGFSGSFSSGLSTSWHHDNIHPNTKGQIAVAAAFAAALSRREMWHAPGCFVGMIKPGGTFAISGEADFGMPRAIMRDDVVHLHGAISGGAASQVIGALPDFAKSQCRHRRTVFGRTGGVQGLASVEVRNDGNLVSGIAWQTEQVDLSLSYHL